jgi:outer membrane protein
LALYPQAGLEYRSSSYVRYYDGVSAPEAQRIGLPVYAPGAASNLFAALFVEAKISGHWYFNMNVRRTWQDHSVGDSPLVRRRVVDTGLITFSYRFD